MVHGWDENGSALCLDEGWHSHTGSLSTGRVEGGHLLGRGHCHACKMQRHALPGACTGHGTQEVRCGPLPTSVIEIDIPVPVERDV